jgi:hypothetical protein
VFFPCTTEIQSTKDVERRRESTGNLAEEEDELQICSLQLEFAQKVHRKRRAHKNTLSMMINVIKKREHPSSNRRENCVRKPIGSRGCEVALFLFALGVLNRLALVDVMVVPNDVTAAQKVQAVVETVTMSNYVVPVGRIYSSCTCAFTSIDLVLGSLHAAAVATSSNSTTFVDSAIHYVATNTLPRVSRQLFIAGTALAAMCESVDYHWLVNTAANIMFLVVQLALACIIYKAAVAVKLMLDPLSKLDESDKTAMLDYTGKGYLAINHQLRRGKKVKVPVAMKKRIAAIQTAMDKLKTYQGKVYRGIASLPKKDRAGLKPNAIYTDFAFMSTSRVPGEAFGKHSKERWVFEIESKTGVDIQAASNYKKEAEVLFRPGTRFRIKRVVGQRVFMEEIA